MPFAQFHHPFDEDTPFADRFPADYICEGLDQTRGWFYSLLAVSTLVFGEASYRNCVCLGLILDAEGQKMSKSRGNVVDPWEVLGEHGADALRWYYFTAQQPWAGYRFSSEALGETVHRFVSTLWNTYSFWVLYANAEDLQPGGLPVGQVRGAPQVVLGQPGRVEHGCDPADVLGLARVGRGGERQLRSRQAQAGLQHRRGLERLGARAVEHRPRHVAALPPHTAVGVGDHQCAVVRALVQPAAQDAGQFDVAGRRVATGMGREEAERAHHARPAAALRIASIRAWLSSPRCSTISATPRPLTSASWATAVACS